MKVRIIGGGLSGLFAAYAFKKNGFQVEIFEKSRRWGGLVQTLHLPWGLVETAANGLLNSVLVEQMGRDLNLELLPMQKAFRRRYIYRERPRRMPLSGLELFRFVLGVIRRKPPRAGEGLSDYAARTFGLGATRYLIEPAVLGIFAVEARELSASLVYDYFFKTRIRKGKRPKTRGTVAPRKGMGQLVDHLVQWLKDHGVTMHLGSAGEISREGLNLIATDAISAADILEPSQPSIAQQLRQIRYQSLCSITLGFDEPGSLKGFGCLLPRPENFNSYGVLFNSYVFAGRGPLYSETWITPCDARTEDEIMQKVRVDRERLFSKQIAPAHHVITRWQNALPIYDVHLERTLHTLSLPAGVRLFGNYMGHIGLSRLLEDAFSIAEGYK